MLCPLLFLTSFFLLLVFSAHTTSLWKISYENTSTTFLQQTLYIHIIFFTIINIGRKNPFCMCILFYFIFLDKKEKRKEIFVTVYIIFHSEISLLSLLLSHHHYYFIVFLDVPLFLAIFFNAFLFHGTDVEKIIGRRGGIFPLSFLLYIFFLCVYKN